MSAKHIDGPQSTAGAPSPRALDGSLLRPTRRWRCCPSRPAGSMTWCTRELFPAYAVGRSDRVSCGPRRAPAGCGWPSCRSRRRRLAPHRTDAGDEQVSNLLHGDHACRPNTCSVEPMSRRSSASAWVRVRPSRVDATRLGPILCLTWLVPTRHLPYQASCPVEAHLTISAPVPRGR